MPDSPKPDPFPTRAVDSAGESSSEDALLHSRCIGDFTLVRIIASGGMGTVWEALQHDPRRTVAVKVMKHGLDSPAARVRFERESELLARLQHPHIAVVHRSGVDQLGGRDVPYFAMEYIAGARTITAYASHATLNIAQRVDLLIQAAGAVQHGHERGIWHRDLKPANLLVDANGYLKLIDFGIAHAADAHAATLAHTGGSELIGTIRYMSPEQCTDPHTVDGRSDTYSLGVIAYELLTGQMPYELHGLGLAQIAHVICTASPPPASGLNPQIESTLERVLAKSLEKLPSARYATMAELASDLRKVNGGVGAVQPARRIVPRLTLARLLLILVIVALAVGMCRQLEAPTVLRSIGGRWFESSMIQLRTLLRPKHNLSSRVALVGLTDNTDVERIAREQDLSGVVATRAGTPSLRRLYGSMIPRVVEAGAKVVVFDVAFVGPTEFDADFVTGVKTAKDAGVPVVCVMPRWSPENVSPAIRQAVRLGGASGVQRDGGFWSYHIASTPPGGETVPSLGLLAQFSALYPKHELGFNIDDQASRVEVTITPSSGVPMTLPRPVDEVTTITSPSNVGFVLNTQVALDILEMPPVDAFKEATIDLNDIFAMDRASLTKRLGGRILVIGNMRAGAERLFQYADGQWLLGVQTQVAMMGSEGTRVLTKAPMWQRLSFAAGICAFSAALAIRWRGNKWSGTASALLSGATAIALGTVLFVTARHLLNPIPAAYGGALAALLTSACLKQRYLNRGQTKAGA